MVSEKTFLKIKEPLEIECAFCGEIMQVSKIHCAACASKLSGGQ